MSLTLSEAADSLKVSTRTVRREIAAGKIPVVKVRGCIRIEESHLDAYKKANTCQCVAMVPDGRPASSMGGGDLAKLLGLSGTRRSGKRDTVPGSRIVELAEARAMRSRKQSPNG